MKTEEPSDNGKAVLGSHQAPLEKSSTNSNPTGTNDNAMERFLLAEYSELAQDWRHTDSRIETAINFYITVGAVVLTGLGILYQALQSVQLFILASVPVAVVLFVFGVFLTLRITSADLKKGEYRLGMRIIRRYFADREAEDSRYMYRPVASSINGPEDIAKQRSPHFHERVVLAINTFNSFIVGVCSASLIWLVFGNVLLPIGIALISLGLSAVSLILLSWFLKRRITNIKPSQTL
jgi:hypothetical protein